jgi:hypothetical protein
VANAVSRLAFTLATYVHLLPDDLPDPDDLLGEETQASVEQFSGLS